MSESAAATPEARSRRSTLYPRGSVEFSPVLDDALPSASTARSRGRQSRSTSKTDGGTGRHGTLELSESATTPVKRWLGRPLLDSETCLTSPVTSALLGGADAPLQARSPNDGLSSSPDDRFQGDELDLGRTPRASSGGASGAKVAKRRSGCRQDCSLFKLTRRFLDLVFKTDDGLLDLNAVAERLGVKKRRIYDITNVLEGVGIIEKQGKNHIRWKGMGESAAGNPDTRKTALAAVNRDASGEAPAKTETATVQRAGLTTDGNAVVCGVDLAADQEILRLREEILELEKSDRLLDEQIRILRDDLRRLSTSEKVMRYAYLTDEDILSLSIFQKHMVIAVQAPPGTELLWGDDPKARNRASKAVVYQLHVRSSGGAIECYLLSAGIGGEHRRHAGAALTSNLSLQSNGPDRARICNERAPVAERNGMDVADGSWVPALRRRAHKKDPRVPPDANAAPWRAAAPQKLGAEAAIYNSLQAALPDRGHNPIAALTFDTQLANNRDCNADVEASAFDEAALRADIEEFEAPAQSYASWGSGAPLSIPASPTGSSRTLEAVDGIVELASPLRCMAPSGSSPTRLSFAATAGGGLATMPSAGHDGIRPFPMRSVCREPGIRTSLDASSATSIATTVTIEQSSAAFMYTAAANARQGGPGKRSNGSASAVASAAVAGAASSAAPCQHGVRIARLNTERRDASPVALRTHFVGDDVDDRTRPEHVAYGAPDPEGHTTPPRYKHLHAVGEDAVDDFHGEVLNLRRQQERGETLHPGTVSPGGTLKLRRASSPYASPLIDGVQRFSPFRRGAVGAGLHLDYELDGSFSGMLACVSGGALTRSPSPPLLQDLAVESLLLDHTRDRAICGNSSSGGVGGSNLMDLFISTEPDFERSLS